MSDNSAGEGGGIFIDREDLDISGSTLSGNDGGAIYSFTSNVAVQNSVVSNNHSSPEGGGIRAFAIQITNSTIANNSANIGGGLSAQSLSAIGCTVAGNSAADYAGGIQSSLATIIDCSVSGNFIKGSLTLPHPVNDGGGIYGKGFITNSTVSGNSALNNGGGVSGNWTIRNSTITGNRADSDGNGGGGGGGYGTPSLPGAATLTLFNTIVAGNVRGAPDAETNDDIRIAGGTMAPSSSFNLIGDPNSAGGLVHGASGNIVGDGIGNLLDVSTVLDTTLADNGGPTLTHALVPGSPAFNAGDPLFDPNAMSPPTPFDQRGDGFARVKGGRLDIGAFEGIPDPQPASGVIVVGTFADVIDSEDGLWSLREAVIYANSHSEDNELQLAAGTYTLTRQGANEDAALTGDLDVLNNGGLKIVGASSTTTTIDASGLFNAARRYGDRIFDVKGNSTVAFEKVKLTGGTTPNLGASRDLDGGAILNQSGTLSIVDCILSGNSASRSGGAIYGRGHLTVVDSTLSNNVSTRGGAIFQTGGTIDISGSTISGNKGGANRLIAGQMSVVDSTFVGNSLGQSGGAISIDRSSLTVLDSVFTGNSGLFSGGAVDATGFNYVRIGRSIFNGNKASTGGAIYTSSGTLLLTDSSLEENQSTSKGGGLTNIGSNVTIERTTLESNSSVEGGGIYNSPAGRMSIRDSTLSMNTAALAGGIAYYSTQFPLLLTNTTLSGNLSEMDGGALLSSGHVVLSNSTITGNRADSDDSFGNGGGLLILDGAVVTLTNTIVAGNFKGFEYRIPSDIELYGGQVVATSSFNLVGDPNTSGGLADGVNGNIIGDGGGNLLDVSSILDTTLADNGGATRTHALVPGGLAIDAGDPLFNPNASTPPVSYDQRAAGYGRVFGERVDIGAFEFGSTFQSTVAGRHVFYDNSAGDGNVAGSNFKDELVIAIDKQPLLPGVGVATAANATSYSGGINGIMIDLAGSHPGITAADFIFRVGNNNSPETWALAPPPETVTVLAGQGDAGADRVVITWPSGSIVNAWLEVQVLATANTGLAASDVFYWGSKVGDSFTNPGAGTFNTTTADASQVFANLGSGKPITNLRDYNRDGVIDTADASIVFANLGSIVRLSILAAASPAVKTPEVRVDGTVSAVASALAARGADRPSTAGPSQQVALPRATQPLPPRDQFFADLILEKAISANERDQDDLKDGSFAAGAADEHADELTLVLLGDR